MRGAYLGDFALSHDCKTPPDEIYGGAQIPMLVTLQSAGDTATGTWMPWFLRIAQPFAGTLSTQEAREQVHARGWIDAFRTHTLDFNTDSDANDLCLNASVSYCPFATSRARPQQAAHPRSSGRVPLVLQYAPGSGADQLPAFFPLWSFMVGKNIMNDHDDIWNPQIVWLINRLFRDAYMQSEIEAGRLQPPPPGVAVFSSK